MKHSILLILAMLYTTASKAQTDQTAHLKTAPNMILTQNGTLVITPTASSSKKDFDFLHGHWAVINTKRERLLEGNENWNKFNSTSETQKILLGIGNVEKYTAIIQEKPFEGSALRIFNPKTRLWSIYWSDSNNGTLDPPMVGSFEGRVGDFYAKDNYLGHHIIVRFNWNATDPKNPIWSQAFSVDDGKSWEWNWYMYFSREPKPAVPASGINVLEVRNYLLKKNKGVAFNNLFQKELINTQIAIGGFPMGEYAPKKDPNHFYWFRGFESMESRSLFLKEFYYGPAWKKNRTAANGMIVNNDNVHLLKPLLGLEAGSNLLIDRNWFNNHGGIAVVDYYISNQKRPKFIELIRHCYLPAMRNAGIEKISFWISEDEQNTFLQLPVFQDGNLVLSIAFYKSEIDYRAKKARTEKLLTAMDKEDLADAITLHRTEIVYPLAHK
jgi:hypothetical protein